MGPILSLIPNSRTILRAISVARCRSLPAPVDSEPSTSLSAQRPPIITASAASRCSTQ